VQQIKNTPANFSQLQFSMDGQKFLAVCDGNIFVMDAFEGNFITHLSNGAPEQGAPRQACFSCDSNYVLSGGSTALRRGEGPRAALCGRRTAAVRRAAG
jgi:hypothetical protein